MSLVHIPTGLKQFALIQSFSRGNYNTFGRLWKGGNTPLGAINKLQSKVLDDSNNNPLNRSNNSTISMEQQTQSGDNNQVQANNNPGASTVPSTSSRPNSAVGYVVIPYTKWLPESFKHTCGKYGIQTYFKGNTMFKQVLMKPKDQDHKEKKSEVIYSFQCNHITCDEDT